MSTLILCFCLYFTAQVLGQIEVVQHGIGDTTMAEFPYLTGKNDLNFGNKKVATLESTVNTTPFDDIANEIAGGEIQSENQETYYHESPGQCGIFAEDVINDLHDNIKMFRKSVSKIKEKYIVHGDVSEQTEELLENYLLFIDDIENNFDSYQLHDDTTMKKLLAVEINTAETAAKLSKLDPKGILYGDLLAEVDNELKKFEANMNCGDSTITGETKSAMRRAVPSYGLIGALGLGAAVLSAQAHRIIG